MDFSIVRKVSLAMKGATLISLLFQLGGHHVLFLTNQYLAPRSTNTTAIRRTSQHQETSEKTQLRKKLSKKNQQQQQQQQPITIKSSNKNKKLSNSSKTKIPPYEIYWNASCPLEESRFSIHALYDNKSKNWLKDPSSGVETIESYTLRSELSKNFSLQSRSIQIFRHALLDAKIFANRKIVIVGDSLQRQLFTSLSCLGQDQIEKYAMRWVDDKPHSRMDKNEARVRWKNGGGEVFYSPKAGRIFNYSSWIANFTVPSIQPKTMSWLSSCRKREVFRFVSYRLPKTGEENNERGGERDSRWYVPKNNDYSSVYERIVLGKDDVVILNGSVHRSRRTNLDALVKLLDCMDDARAKGEANKDWPSFVYTRSTYKETGWVGGPQCGTNMDHSFQQKEEERFKGRLDIIGDKMNYHNLSAFHVWGPRKDCAHFMQPGVPDLVSAELSKNLISRFGSKKNDEKELMGRVVSDFGNLTLASI